MGTSKFPVRAAASVGLAALFFAAAFASAFTVQPSQPTFGAGLALGGCMFLLVAYELARPVMYRFGWRVNRRRD